MITFRLASKRCFKCGKEKLITEFYKHPAMSDGYLNKCKECTKNDVRKNYSKNHDYYLSYEHERKTRPERKKANLEYMHRKRERRAEMYKAHCAVNNAIRDGKIIPQPCEECGSAVRVEAHHEDYSKPLDVVWLCLWCHRKRHKRLISDKASRKEATS